MNFGQKIKELRKKRQLTQSELAEQAGVTLRTLQRIENGEVNASLYSKGKLSEVLEFDFDENHEQEEQLFEIKLTIKNMNHFIQDLRLFLNKHWKSIALILLIFLFLSNYKEIKAGFYDGWTK